MKFFKSKQESGFTLLEVVASIVILEIILTSFYSLLIQSAKATKQSEEIIDATYIAQNIMEESYNISKSFNYVNLNEQFDALDNHLDGFEKIEDEEYQLMKEIENTDYLTTVQLLKDGAKKDLTPIVIQVIEVNGESKILKAQMQNTLRWGNSY